MEVLCINRNGRERNEWILETWIYTLYLAYYGVMKKEYVVANRMYSIVVFEENSEICDDDIVLTNDKKGEVT